MRSVKNLHGFRNDDNIACAHEMFSLQLASRLHINRSNSFRSDNDCLRQFLCYYQLFWYLFTFVCRLEIINKIRSRFEIELILSPFHKSQSRNR